MHLTFNEPINACNDGNDGLHGIGCSSAGLRLLCLMIRLYNLAVVEGRMES